MRHELQHIADRLGVRRGAAHCRDELVARLTGSGQRDPVFRRNDEDDRRLHQFLSFALKPGSNCLDVGAHEGLFLADFRRVAPNGLHIAYEPVPHLFRHLAVAYPEVDVRERALSNDNGEISFVFVPEEPAYSGIDSWTYPIGMKTEPITVGAERLDDHVPNGWLPDFVKIDVEGAEGLVMEGAVRTLRSARPAIAFEHGCGGSDHLGVSDRDLYSLLARRSVFGSSPWAARAHSKSANSRICWRPAGTGIGWPTSELGRADGGRRVLTKRPIGPS